MSKFCVKLQQISLNFIDTPRSLLLTANGGHENEVQVLLDKSCNINLTYDRKTAFIEQSSMGIII